MDPQAAFKVLQPASIRIAREQTAESVQAMSRGLEQVLVAEKILEAADDTSCINEIKEYLLFPLFIILKSGKKLSGSFTEEIVRCTILVLRHSRVDDFTLFKEVFGELFTLLSNPLDPRKPKNQSEECKLMILTALTLLLNNSEDSIHDQVNSRVFRPQLGHAVFICLKLAQEEKNRSLRIETMECLLALGQQKSFKSSSAKKQTVLSSTFTHFLPGIVTGLARIAAGDEKQGHKITSIAIDGWIYFVVLVMRDEFLEEKVSRFEESETVAQLRSKLCIAENSDKAKEAIQREKKSKFDIAGPEEEENLASKLPNLDIDRKWVHDTAGKLVLISQTIIKLVSHSHWKVRLSLVHFAEKLICKCHKSLTGAVVLALQVIVTLRSDDIVDVGSAAQDALLRVMNVIDSVRQGSQVQKGFLELLEEHVYALCTQLPTIFRQQEDTKTLSSVRQLGGCLEVLGSRISQLMTWPTHSARLLRSLCFGLTVDVTDSDLLLERTSAEDPFSVLIIKPSLGRSFRYFQDVRIFESLSSSCKLIGYHSDVTVVSDLCLELLQETQARREAFFMFTLVVQGRDRRKWNDKDGDCVSPDDHENAVRNILDSIINLEIFEVPLSVATPDVSNNSTDGDDENVAVLVPVNRQPNISADLVKSNVVLVTNALNLVGATAQMIGKDFEMFLSNILCSVMEKAGDANVLVGYTARNTLAEIAKACGYENEAKLIENTVPYYWYALSLKLKRVLQYPSAPLVLQVCLEYASIDVIAFTEELVQEVLVCLDTYHSDQAVPLLRVLLVYVMAVIRYEKKPSDVEQNSNECETFDSSNNEGTSNGSVSVAADKITKAGDLSLFLMDYHSKQVDIRKSIEKEEEKCDTDVEKIKRDMAENAAASEEDWKDESEHPEEKKPEVPTYVKHVVEILEKCSHMLYIQERKLKLLILETIKAGSEALAKWENERLPIFHKLWKPLVLRLKDVDFVVMMRSFEVLTVMAVSSGDFLRRRILKEVFPLVFSFLKKQSVASLKKTKKSGYYMTTGYRAQCTLLRLMPGLVTALSMGVLEISELLHILILYADSQQPQQLQSFSLKCVEKIAENHPHHVWLALAYQQPSVRIVPPKSCLDAVQIRSSPAGHLIPEALELYRQLS